jgi:endoglucanase
MDQDTFLLRAREFMSLPTAPFHEHWVIAAIEAFAAARPRLVLDRDQAGNLLLRYTHPRAPRAPRLVATAHLDHPGLGFPHPLGRGEYFFEKLGGVDLSQALGSQVRLYDLRGAPGQRPCLGRILSHCREGQVEGFVVASPTGTVLGPGWFGMWDLPALRRRGQRLYGRACDDLAGAVAGLCCLDELIRRRAKVRAGLLLTRAEEVGFGGMLAAVHGGWVDPEAIYLNLECSSARAGAVMGGGPILRVGDRASLFDPQLSGGMALLAAELAQAEPAFCFQRKLMDGGACEASALGGAGYRTAALALPLGNYHNKGKRGLAPEFIHLGDAGGLVRLLVHLSCAPGGLERAGAMARANTAHTFASLRRRHARRLRQTLSADFGERS